MKIEQFYDEALAHAAYALISEGEMALIDPGRDPQQYYDYAQAHQARIVAVLETHPHADFVSAHLEIHQSTGAEIYVHPLLGASYPHTPLEDGDTVKIGAVEIRALHTPGHSPDSNSYLLLDAAGKPHSLFTGDTLFVGDVGRPDLREHVGNVQAKASELAYQLYQSTREKIMPLDPLVRIYPAHGPGSLCGRNIRPDLHSTIGRELAENYALQDMSADDFVALITAEQAWIPGYFAYNVALNRKGAKAFKASIASVKRLNNETDLEPSVLCIDTRNASAFRAGHIPGSLNIPENNKFETWLGAVVAPEEAFYLLGTSEEKLMELMERVAKIGYEGQVKGILWNFQGTGQLPEFNPEVFQDNPDAFQLLDVRNAGEVKAGKIFPDALSIPLYELRKRLKEIPLNKPIVVHCAGGLRSGIASSILAAFLPNIQIWDMGTHIQTYTKKS